MAGDREPKTRKCQLCGRRFSTMSDVLKFVALRAGGRAGWFCFKCRNLTLTFYGKTA